MSSPADPHSILNRTIVAPTFQKPNPKAKVHRYRRGQGPEREEPEEDDNDDIYPASVTHFSEKDSVVGSNVPSRNEDEEINARLARRRQIQRSVIVEESKGSEAKKKNIEENGNEDHTDENDEEIEARRRRAKLKEKLLEQEKVTENDMHLQNMGDEDEMEDETNEPEEEGGIISMLKPVYIPKQERESNNKMIEEEKALKDEERRLKEKRKQEAKMMSIEAIRKDDEIEKNENNLSDGDMPNDADDIDEANQYEQWKIRELKRIKRDREETNKRDKEKAEIERRRRLTDAERAYENKMLGSDDTMKPEKLQYKFMQKYYHKGSFFQDSDDPIFKRENLAVGEDLWDKSSLPKILQTRRGEFGKANRSKYTHLTDQDTTNFDPQYRVNEQIQEHMKNKGAGYKGQNSLDRPSARKR